MTAAYLLYNNFNQLLSNALKKSFEASILSEVYELNFEDLRVNVLEGSIQVYNVSLHPREKPLYDYPYINSSFRLTTEKIMLENVEIRTLLELNKLILDKILITNPAVEVTLTGERNIMLPFRDSTAVARQPKAKNKKSLDSFVLNEFQLIDASFYVTNSGKQREFKIKNFNISLHDLSINQQPGEYLTSFSQVTFSVGEFMGNLQKGPLKQVGFKDFKIGIDSLEIQMTLDTLIYHFRDLNTAMHDLDIQTADSIYHVSMKSFDLSYKSKSVKLSALSFKPNVSHAVLQKSHRYQHTEFSGDVGTLNFINVNFDSLFTIKKY